MKLFETSWMNDFKVYERVFDPDTGTTQVNKIDQQIRFANAYRNLLYMPDEELWIMYLFRKEWLLSGKSKRICGNSGSKAKSRLVNQKPALGTYWNSRARNEVFIYAVRCHGCRLRTYDYDLYDNFGRSRNR